MKLNRFILIAILTLPVSCQVIRFTSISDRVPVRESIRVSEQCILSSTGPVFMNVAGLIKAEFMGPGIRIDYRDLVIFIDPLEVRGPVQADYIFITHNHADHFSMPDIGRLSGEGTVIVAPPPAAKKLGDYSVRETSIGDTLQLGEISCVVVPSYNIKRGFFHMPLHRRSDDYAGYILSLGDTRIYHAGDTDLIPEMSHFGAITVALVPIGEGKTAMTPERAAEAVNMIQPRIAIPIHYEIDQGREDIFVNTVNNNTRVELFLQDH